MTTFSTAPTFSHDPIQNAAKNLRTIAENLTQRLLTLSSDPNSSLDEIGKLQRAITGIFTTLKRQPVAPPEPEAIEQSPPEPTISPKTEMPDPRTTRETQKEPVPAVSPEAQPPAPSGDVSPPSGACGSPAPVKPKPPRGGMPSRYGPPRSSKPPKTMRRMMKRARRNGRERKK